VTANHARGVFQTAGLPTTTYVRREEGKYELALRDSVEGSPITVITGPSKTGKTSLYRTVLEQGERTLVVVRCDNSQTEGGFWSAALQALGAAVELDWSESLETRSETEVAAELGVDLLAKGTGSVRRTSGKTTGSDRRMAHVRGDPGPRQLVEALGARASVLVIEDFQYLSERVGETLFQQTKVLVDSQVPVVVVCTPQHASDVMRLNRDLIGRTRVLRIGNWRPEDLRKIAEQGFAHLGVTVAPEALSLIAVESLGIPFITQLICREMVVAATQRTNGSTKGMALGHPDAVAALRARAREEARGFGDVWQPVGKAQRELWARVLAAFTLDPLKSALTLDELARRLRRLRHPDKPGASSPEALAKDVKSAVESFAKRTPRVVEWSEANSTLYVVDPIFLFYRRWSTPRAQPCELERLAFEIVEALREPAATE
jgi:hypothetical protein